MSEQVTAHMHATGEEVHTPITWAFADQTAREAFDVTERSELDLGRWALQEDDGTVWRLTDLDPLTWAQVGAPEMTGATASENGTGGTVPAPEAGDEEKVLKGDGAWGTITGVPPGAVAWYAADSPPDGWLECDGAAVSRSTYADLFAAIGTTFGAGDGSTTFALPDLRGQFVRGWDNGRGVDSGRSFGSTQTDDNKAHSHSASYPLFSSPHAVSSFQPDTGWNQSSYINWPCSSSGGTEARPKNVALMPIIKY